MKLKKIGLGLLTFCSLNLLSPAYANITVYSGIPNNDELCTKIAGSWKGEGVISNPLLTCYYLGSVDITKKDEHKPAINLVINLEEKKLKTTKELKGWPCPERATLPLNGTCENGVIKIYSPPNVDLNGHLSEAGSKAHVTGKILHLDADIKLNKTSG